LINLLANAFLHEILDKGRPRIHDIATLYQQLDERATIMGPQAGALLFLVQ
jgi:hypothetical protein